MKKTSIAIIAIVVIVILWVLGSYNGFVSAQQGYTQQWAQVQTQYQRRFDLIPNIVELAKGAQKQEQSVFTAIAEARTRYSGAATQAEKVAATNQVESALSRLLVITENYPDLKSNAVLQDAIVQLEGTENRISVERQKYNTAVGTYNLKVQRFPGSIFASIFNFSVQPYFEAAQGADVAPKVQL